MNPNEGAHMLMTVTLGDILTITAFALSIVIGYFKLVTRIEQRLTSLETMVEPLWEWFINGREPRRTYERERHSSSRDHA